MCKRTICHETRGSPCTLWKKYPAIDRWCPRDWTSCCKPDRKDAACISRPVDRTRWHRLIAYDSPTPGLRFSACPRSEEHTSELQSRGHLVCRLLLEKKN